LTFNLVMETGGITFLTGDQTRLRQILLNLLGNALKFTSDGGISMKVSKLLADDPEMIEEGDHTLKIIISDTGKGIAKERLDHIFEAFMQEDTSITRKFGGSGLGLAIVKSLADLMGGHVSIKSKIDEGTQITLLLPFTRPSDEEVLTLTQSKLIHVQKVQMQNMNVLVVEDNVINASIAKGFLELLGHRVFLAGNGKIAVDYLDSGNSVDLVFMDVHMPVMDGVEATQLIRKMPTRKGLPILGLTAEAFVSRHQEFLKAGMNDVLTKPFTQEQLVQVIMKNVEVKKGAELVDASMLEEKKGQWGTLYTKEVDMPDNTKNSKVVSLHADKSRKDRARKTTAAQNRKARNVNNENSETLSPEIQTPEIQNPETQDPETQNGEDQMSAADQKLEEPLLPIGDVERLEEIRQCLPPGEIDSLLAAAQISLEELLCDLRAGVEKSDSKQISEVAHAIKGASGSLFAARLSQLAGKIEIKAGELEIIRELMPDFEETAAATLAWWKSMSAVNSVSEDGPSTTVN